MTSTARKSLTHLADKFNVAPPPGYVPGRGRGVSGFSKPPEEPPKRGSAAPSSSGSAQQQRSATTEGLEGDAADTRELDLSETQRYEEQEISMDEKEAGVQMEAFNMTAEREEGHFDDDFNYVWKKGGGDEDIKDAWLTETDGAGQETEEKVAKRRKLLAGQISALEAPEETVDTAALYRAAAALLKPRETVAGGLKRLSIKPKRQQGKAGVGSSKEEREAAVAAAEAESAANKKLFNELTEAADALLRGGDLDIYTATKEKLEEKVEQAEQAAEAEASAAAAAEAAEAEAARGGVSAELHEAAVAGGFEPHGNGVYFNSSSNLFFDPKSSLYWPQGASDEGPYYYFDAASQQFVDAATYGAGAGGEAGGGEQGGPDDANGEDAAADGAGKAGREDGAPTVDEGSDEEEDFEF